MDATNHHLHKPVMIGEIEGNGQFNVVWQTEAPVRAQPWSPYIAGNDKNPNSPLKPPATDLTPSCGRATLWRMLMKAMRFIRGVLLLTWLLPWIAQAADADTFTAANRTQQAALLEQWSVKPDVQRLPVLKALSDENLLTDNAKNAFIMNGSHVQPLGTAAGPNGELKKSA